MRPLVLRQESLAAGPYAAWSGIAQSPGSLASGRLPLALAKRTLLVRPQSLAEAFCAAARRLGVTQAQPLAQDPYASSWARLFQQEPAYLFAQIVSFSPADAGHAFSEAQERDPRLAAHLIGDLARDLQGWIRRMDFDVPGLFTRQLEQLDAEIRLRDRLGVLATLRGSRILDMLRDQAQAADPQPQGHAIRIARDLHEQLRATHTLLRNAAATFQPIAQAAFERRIESRQMDPALGLLIAELRAARHVEASLNRLPERHTRHYYDAIIGQQPAPAGAERVLLAFDPGPRPLYLAPGAALDARLPDRSIQKFASEAGVQVSAASVGEVMLLAYETDPHISFNATFGGITGLRAARLPPGGVAEDQGARLFFQGDEIRKPMGLDISSPMLALAEGVRLVEVSLHMKRGSDLAAGSRPLSAHEVQNPGPMPDPELRLALASDPELVAAILPGRIETAAEELALAVSELARARNITPSMSLIYEYVTGRIRDLRGLRLLLSRIAALSLIERAPFPSGDYWTNLYALIDAYRPELTGQRAGEADSYADALQDSAIFAAFSERPDGTIDYTPEDVFQSLLGDAFEIRLSSAQGPVAPSFAQILPIRAARSAGGITLALRLDAALPAIQGPAPDQAPVLSLRHAENARICPVSFFERYALDSVEFTVRVSGLHRLTAFSDDGPVSTDQTFMPFGVRPDEGATFQIGSPEMAMKPVREIGIELGWDAIPDRIGGFARHYAGYPRGIRPPDPVLRVDYLSGDGWKPVGAGKSAMLQSVDISGELSDAWRFSGVVAGHSIPAGGRVTAAEYQSRQTVRAGMVRLTLSGTERGFNADQYPLALVQAMRPRLLPFDRRQRRIPAAPFVPQVARISLSYMARAVMQLNDPDSAAASERVVQVGPFGRVEVFPQRMLRDLRLFPARLGYGQLCIQITGPGATGPTVLCFEMAASGHLRLVPRPNPIRWLYLSAQGWKDMPETALSSDTTMGLMRSGLVMIDLPDDAIEHSPEMPGGGVWIAAAAMQPDLQVFPTLRRISVNGVWALRGDQSWRGEDSPPRAWAFNPAQPGIGKIREIVTPSAVRPPETPDHYIARVGERLRHRKRAVTPWDLERLVLQEFPEVWMAKCLAHLDRRSMAPAPGVATLVAVRRPPDGGPMLHPAPCLFDVAVLSRIRDFLTAHGPEFARFDVVNPAFERLQVRAKVAFHPERENGAMAQALRQELARYLSVWTAGPALCRFGWSLNTRMLLAHIADLPMMRGVTDFSVLHLAADDGQSHELWDTAQPQDDPRGPYGPVIRPRRPWALPLSAADHVLTVLSELEDETPEASGIGSLSVGDMLIVGQRTVP